jgi:hypothetical protein
MKDRYAEKINLRGLPGKFCGAEPPGTGKMFLEQLQDEQMVSNYHLTPAVSLRPEVWICGGP